MMQAIQIVRPALARLYDSLSDEQKQRLDALGTEESHNGGATAAAASTGASTLVTICDRQAASFTKLPVQDIEEIVKPIFYSSHGLTWHKPLILFGVG